MSVNWRTTEFGTFEVVDRQGLSAKIFGGFMLFFAGCFLYWLGTAVVEYFRFGTWRDVLVALPGMAVTLLMAALFGVPGVLMAFLKKRTLCNKADGLIRQVKSFGVFRRVREFRLSDVQLVASTFKTTRSSNFNRSGGGTEVLHGRACACRQATSGGGPVGELGFGTRQVRAAVGWVPRC